ncbi:MAG: metal-dependent hydrolase [Lentisphaerae bacterium]|nr:metal-dependent hydrolase [Lentisphaerota bacterium]
MPSPVGHSLIGLALSLAWRLPRWLDWPGLGRAIWQQRGWLLLGIVLANAPDIDYFFGIFRGNLNFYHQTGTHTIIWVGLVSLAVWILVRRREGSGLGFIWLLVLTSSHLLADYLCLDTAPPRGLPLFWPLAGSHWTSPISIFPAPAKATWAELWTWHNLGVVAVELLLTLPLVAAVLAWKRKRRVSPRLHTLG